MPFIQVDHTKDGRRPPRKHPFHPASNTHELPGGGGPYPLPFSFFGSERGLILSILFPGQGGKSERPLFVPQHTPIAVSAIKL